MSIQTFVCPTCGEPIDVDDEVEEIPAGSIVRHAPGECPQDKRDPSYEYVGTFLVHRLRNQPGTAKSNYDEVTNTVDAVLKVEVGAGMSNADEHRRQVAEAVIEALIDEHGLGLLLVGTELTRVSATMEADTFASIGAELATKVGNRLNTVLQNASLIDRT